MASPLLPPGVDSLPVPDDKLPLRADARDHLANAAGIDRERAGVLLDAAVRAAMLEAVDSLASEVPMPGTMSDLRALRLYRISALLGSTPTADEVGALFRVPRTTAMSIVRRMEAQYSSIRERDLMASIKSGAGRRPQLTRVEGEKADWYSLGFKDEHALDACLTKLSRLGVTDIREVAGQKFAIAIAKTTPTGANVLDGLGLQRPAGE